ncbi:MAG: hypothetical protein IJF54_06830 [Clostridia bacterium]|nr:hypothetical protein [Clostridia bacterium]
MDFYALIQSIKAIIQSESKFSDVVVDDRYRNKDMLYPMNKVMITVGLEDVNIKTYIDTAEDGTESERRMISASVGFDIFLPKTSEPDLTLTIFTNLMNFLFVGFPICKFKSMQCEKVIYDSQCGAYRLSFAATTEEVTY